MKLKLFMPFGIVRLLMIILLTFFLMSLFYFISDSFKSFAEVWILLAVIYLLVFLLAYFRFAQPIFFYTMFMKIAPRYVLYYNNRGLAYARRGEYELARQDFEYGMALKPEFAQLYVSRGALYNYLQKYSQALHDLDRALQLNPNFMIAYNNRGALYIRMHEYGRAIQDYDQALRLKPNFYLALLGRAEAYMNLKDFTRAMQDWGAADNVARRSIVVKNVLGDIYLASREYERAVEAYSEALGRSSRGLYLQLKGGVGSYKAAPLTSRSMAYCALMRYQEALQDAEQAVSLAPDLGEAYGSRGMAQLGLANLAQARNDLVRCHELSPRNSLFGLLLAWVEMCFVEPDHALIEYLEANSEINPQHFSAYICRGIALWLQGKPEEALYTLEQVNMLETTRWEIYFWIGMIEISLGFDQEGLGALNRAIDLGIPVGLLAPLNQFQQKRPEFYARYVASLLRPVLSD